MAVEWLAEAPLSGTVVPGGSAVVTVAVSGGGLPAGRYTATLEVASNDPLQPLVAVPVTLTVTCSGMTGADFSWSPPDPIVGSPVHFTASVAGGTAPFLYGWNLGDGSPPLTGQTVTHTFTATGTFTVTLAISDACGALLVRHPIVVSEVIYPIYLPLVQRGP